LEQGGHGQGRGGDGELGARATRVEQPAEHEHPGHVDEPEQGGEQPVGHRAADDAVDVVQPVAQDRDRRTDRDQHHAGQAKTGKLQDLQHDVGHQGETGRKRHPLELLALVAQGSAPAQRQGTQACQEAQRGGGGDAHGQHEPRGSAWRLLAEREPHRVAERAGRQTHGHDPDPAGGQPGSQAPAAGEEAAIREHQQHQRDQPVGGPPGPHAEPRRQRPARQRARVNQQRVVDVLVADHAEGAAEPDGQEQPADRVLRAVGGDQGAQQRECDRHRGVLVVVLGNVAGV
jgi:hypothetical protein